MLHPGQTFPFNMFAVLSLFLQELGNTLDNTKTNEQLQAILTNAVIMVVSVSAFTTQGTELSDEELATVFEACDMVRVQYWSHCIS